MSEEIPCPTSKKAWQKLEKEWKKALQFQDDGNAEREAESVAKVATGILEWFPLTGADRRIREEDDDAEDFNQHLQSYKAGDISNCINGCEVLLRGRDDLDYRLKIRIWCLKAVALVSQPPLPGMCIKDSVRQALHALRCAHLGEADAFQRTEEEVRMSRPTAFMSPQPPTPEKTRGTQGVPATPSTPASSTTPFKEAPVKGEICPNCHQRVETSLKSHKKKCPQRKVQCKLCKKHCTAESLDKHMRDECDHREVTCEQCDMKMQYKDLNYHKLCRCEKAHVRCKNDQCTWSGTRSQEAEHALTCLYLKVTCPHCLVELLQKDMPGHRCEPVDMDGVCIVCFEGFSSLAKKEVPPAMMIINARRSCSHVQCMKCAESWIGRNADQGLATCPVCRSEYDSTTAFPDYLLRVEGPKRRNGTEHRRNEIIRPPLPSPKEMPPGSVRFVSPLDVRFTHDSISECFGFYFKDGVQITEREELKVLSSAKELLRGDEEPKALEMLDVVWYKNHLYVAGTFNRRLCMYRLLALFATERFGLIKVHVKSQDELREKWKRSYTTKCEGRLVTIRSREEYRVGQCRDELYWPEAVEVLGGDEAGTASIGSDTERTETSGASEAARPTSDTDIDRVVAAFAEFHRMPLDVVQRILQHLTEEQRWLTCMRFRHDPDFGGCPAIVRLEKFVQSCKANGFRSRHSMDWDEDGCFEKILKASGVRGDIASTLGSKASSSQFRSGPGWPDPEPLPSRACTARSLSPPKREVPRPPPPRRAPEEGMEVPLLKPPPPVPPVPPGRERSPPQRSSVKAPPRDVRPPWPPVKAPPAAMPLLARVEREEMAEMKELSRRLEEMEKEKEKEKKAFLEQIQSMKEANAKLLHQLRIEEENHQSALRKVKRLEEELLSQKTGKRELEFHQTQDSTANEGRRSRWGASTRKEPTESAPSDGRVPFLRPESEELNQGHQDSQVESDPWETWRPGEASKEQADEDSHGESDPWETWRPGEASIEPDDEDDEDPWWHGQDPWQRGNSDDETGNSDIQHFARHWRLEADVVHEILAGLKPQEVDMILGRFRCDKWGSSVEICLRRYVDSCRRNGFTKCRQPTEYDQFSSRWGLSAVEVQTMLKPMNSEQRNRVMDEFRCDRDDFDSADSLRDYIGYLRDYNFPPISWERFAEKWHIPRHEVASIFYRLQAEQVEVIQSRFRHNDSSSKASPLAQLQSYVFSCRTNGFWTKPS